MPFANRRSGWRSATSEEHACFAPSPRHDALRKRFTNASPSGPELLRKLPRAEWSDVEAVGEEAARVDIHRKPPVARRTRFTQMRHGMSWRSASPKPRTTTRTRPQPRQGRQGKAAEQACGCGGGLFLAPSVRDQGEGSSHGYKARTVVVEYQDRYAPSGHCTTTLATCLPTRSVGNWYADALCSSGRCVCVRYRTSFPAATAAASYRPGTTAWRVNAGWMSAAATMPAPARQPAYAQRCPLQAQQRSTDRGDGCGSHRVAS